MKFEHFSLIQLENCNINFNCNNFSSYRGAGYFTAADNYTSSECTDLAETCTCV